MSKIAGRIISTVIIIAAIIALTVFMVMNTSNRTRQDAINHMESLTQEQSIMIINYVDNAERTLSSYSSANEITDLLLDPENEDKINAAQKYTESFSKTVSGLEGIYVSNWDTKVLAHTNKETVGMVTRKDKEPLEQLRNAMLAAEDSVYNTGIIMSPASGKQIVSIYKAVYDSDNSPIGLVGLGIYTDSLASTLNNLELNTQSSVFSMVNTADNKYIFCKDDSKVGAETDNTDILDLCKKFNDTESDKTDSFEGKETISFYSYMAGKNWLLMIESPSDEVFEFSRSINLNMIIFCSACIILIVIFTIISIKQKQTVQKLEASKKKQAAITKNLHTAALKDILTDVNNRIKFIDDFSKDDNGNYKIADCPNTPYCFAMFTIPKFSQINIMYGHDAGDAVLANAADVLKSHFGAMNVYRIGSDEFLAAVQSKSSNPANVISEMNNVLSELRRTVKVGNTSMEVPFTAAIVKKSSSITPVVLITLKDMINNANLANNSSAAFIDMDTV